VSASIPPPSPPDPSSEPESTPEEYRQRSLLFADLGRYDEAAGEIAAGLAAAPADAALLATLARIHLAADQPAEALVAADRAVAAAPEEISPMVVRAMALTDNSRYADAARVAAEVLTGGRPTRTRCAPAPPCSARPATARKR
jgi:predicted Zn-dependent protease